MFRKLLNSELNRLDNDKYKLAKKNNIVVVLDNLRSQQNIGSAFRTSDAFMVEKLYLCGICACPPNAAIHKAALGAEFSVDWEYYSDTNKLVEELRSKGYIIISIEQTENSTFLNKFQTDPKKKYAFIFGNEVKGVAQEVVDKSDLILEIPQWGTKHSLNVSVSIGLVLWETVR